MNYKLTALIIIVTLVAGCGTLTTVVRGDAVTSKKLKEKRSYCESIPRVYSGVSYDVCTLYGPPNNTASGFSLVALDLAFSIVFDTVVLPYTIYRQGSDGSIKVK